jgi:hypothetical protein
MSLALIIAGAIELITLILCALAIGANGMSDSPAAQGTDVWAWFWTGTIVAMLVAATHSISNVSW